MDIFLLSILIIIIFFVIGISLIYKGMLNSPDSDAVIDKEEYEHVRTKFDQVKKEEDGLKLQLDSMTLELQDANMRADEADKIKKDVDSLRENDQHRQEMIKQLEINLHFLSQKADQQAKKAANVILALNSKNQRLQEEAKDQLDKISAEDVEALKNEKQALEGQLQENVGKISSLQNDLKDVQEKSEVELQEAKELIDGLQKQNVLFQEGILEITGKISSVENEFLRSQKEKEHQLENAKELINRLRREQQNLTQQGASPEDLNALENEINRVKAESEGRLTEAHQNVGRLQEEVNRLQGEIRGNQHQRIELQQQIEDNQRSLSTIDEASITKAVEAEKEQWLKEKENNDQELDELRETNQFLRQKERLLSQELLRSQTQALGLEKICQEFKKRIERR